MSDFFVIELEFHIQAGTIPRNANARSMRSIGNGLDSTIFLPCVSRAAPSKKLLRLIQDGQRAWACSADISDRTIVVLRITNFRHCCIYKKPMHAQSDCGTRVTAGSL